MANKILVIGNKGDPVRIVSGGPSDPVILTDAGYKNLARIVTRGPSDPVRVIEDTRYAKFTYTGPAGILTIHKLTVASGSQVTVDWGDGTTTIYNAGTGIRTHNYANAGEFDVRMSPPAAITGLYLIGTKITLNSIDIKSCVNMDWFQITYLRGGEFNSRDVSAWRPSHFSFTNMRSGYLGEFNSKDISSWRPDYFHFSTMPIGYLGTFDSKDISDWNPSDFCYSDMPVGCLGTFNSSDISSWTVLSFDFSVMPEGYLGTFNFSDISSWIVGYFRFGNMPSGYLGECNSSDISSWRPYYFLIRELTEYPVTFNSSDVSSWRPDEFSLYNLSNCSGTFNSSDVSSWRPNLFALYGISSGYLGTFNSSHLSSWRPEQFYLGMMPDGYLGTFNFSNISSWRCQAFNLLSMPEGYLGTFNTNDVSSWGDSMWLFEVSSMPSTYTITITATKLSGWFAIYVLILKNNSLSQAKVDQILKDLWAAFPSRYESGGWIELDGSNSAPSGILQAANPPTTGKEYAYELVNDSQDINPSQKWDHIDISS